MVFNIVLVFFKIGSKTLQWKKKLQNHFENSMKQLYMQKIFNSFFSFLDSIVDVKAYLVNSFLHIYSIKCLAQ